MQRSPSGVAQVPLQGLMGWETAARNVGEGLSGALLGSSKMMEEREKVTQMGELAAFSERLRTMADETRQELSGQQVGDWDYAWRAAYAPRLAEAVAELPPAARQAGREWAERYSAQASVEALRDRELEKIDKARRQWRTRVDEAAAAGDEQQATQWLREGQNVFVSSGEMEQEEASIKSRSALARWQKSLQSAPMQALADLQAASEENLPRRTQEREQLRTVETAVRQEARQGFLERLTQDLGAGTWPDAEEWALAHQAGLITTAQERSAQAEQEELSPRARCDWQRRIDECPDEEEVELRFDVLTAPLPREERQALLRRMNQAAGVVAEDRQAMSRQLWNLYGEGCFGCPGDSVALQRLLDLQRAALPLLAEQGAEASAQWVEAFRSKADGWVCFTPQQNRKGIL